MSHYPMFALLPRALGASDVAKDLLAGLGGEHDRLGAELTEVAVERSSDGGAAIIECSPERARDLIADPARRVERFFLSSPLHSIEFWLMSDDLLAIEFGDFDSELYDSGLTEAMRESKRQLALTLHAELVEAGAALVYCESSDDTSETLDSPIERAERVANAYAGGEPDVLLRELRAGEPWLVAARGDAAVGAGTRAWLQGSFLVALEGRDGCLVFEHERHRPLFLPMTAARTRG
ncbi:hypothetical protein [Haliangium sp.]|uniref:hypothetical protein n=1 Tax=Haliangium sp. TaxID=2663208 RepID=UPI003D14FC73